MTDHAPPAADSGNHHRSRPKGELLLLVVSVTMTVAGLLLYGLGHRGLGDRAWIATALLGTIAAAWWVVEAARQGRLGVDVVTILALVGAVFVHELLAGAVIAVMLASGRTLEAQAAGRARRELRSLLERSPTVVHRYDGDQLAVTPVGEVAKGDLLLVRPGEVVPVDGLLVGAAAVLDESALTGEPLPVDRTPGDTVRSGTTNAGGPFDLRATNNADESTYAGIIRLVEEAQASSSPFVRLADRFAIAFLAVSVALAGTAWLITGDPVRAVAVLVVATPCPLILAAPVAMVSGLARAARRGVVIKGGAALERLAGAEVLLLDKTGTLTEGRPTVVDIVTDGEIGPQEVLQLAASLDQVSPHVLASAVVRAAQEQHLTLTLPTEVEEVPGRGIRGRVGARSVGVGKASWLLTGPPPAWTRAVRRRADLDGALTMLVAVDRHPVAAIVLDDHIRTDAARTIRDLRRQGMTKIIMVTGDRADVAQTVGAIIGVDEVLAERTPAEKVEAVRLAGQGNRTVMVGDGINDAPALAMADIGVAIGARGSTASSEAADVVLTVDRLGRLVEAITIARRTRRITRQSVFTPASDCRCSPWSQLRSATCHRQPAPCFRRPSTSPSSSTPSGSCAPRRPSSRYGPTSGTWWTGSAVSTSRSAPTSTASATWLTRSGRARSARSSIGHGRCSSSSSMSSSPTNRPRTRSSTPCSTGSSADQIQPEP